MKKNILVLCTLCVLILIFASCGLKGETPVAKQEKEQTKKASYQLTKEKMLDTSIGDVAYYPQIKGYAGELDMDYMNQSLKQPVEKFLTDDYTNLNLDYKVTEMTDKTLSVVYKGTADNIAVGKVNIEDSVNIDIASTNLITYDNFIKPGARQDVAALLVDYDLPMETEGIRIYFAGENVVFYYMPADDSAKDFVEVTVPVSELQPYLAVNYGEGPVS